jgi:hypothetical protein
MSEQNRDGGTALYLDLLKKTLSYTLWPPPPFPIDTFNYNRPRVKRRIVSAISRVLKLGRMQLAHIPIYSNEDRESGHVFSLHADTMIGIRRLDNIQACVETVIRDRVEGDLIETGVWRGGACILMRAVLAAYGIKDRRVFVADSFEGLPKPDVEKYPVDKDDTHHEHSYFVVSQSAVEHNFRKYGLLDEQVVFLKGWFKDTLPNSGIERLSILRLDGDMYGSTMEALENLYPKLSQNGFCIVDDYALEGCRRAINDYRAAHNIVTEVKKIDWTGIYWRKQ